MQNFCFQIYPVYRSYPYFLRKIYIFNYLIFMASNLLLNRAIYKIFIFYLQGDIMAEDNSTGSNFIWAVTLIIIVSIIAGALYYSGFLGGTKKEKIDINVTTPAAPASR